MTSRTLFIVGGMVVCAATLTCVLVQGRQIAHLRTEQQRLISQSRLGENSPDQLPITRPVSGTAEHRSAASPSLELLRFRSEVTRLTTRRRELFSVTNDNTRLRAQLKNRTTNASAATALPPGYILRSKAQRAGFNTPEATMESFLWAMQNRDLNSLLQALTPDSAVQIETQLRQSGNSTNEFFQRLEGWVGMAILGRRQMPDGSIEANVEVVPGVAVKFQFQLLGGQWRMGLPR